MNRLKPRALSLRWLLATKTSIELDVGSKSGRSGHIHCSVSSIVWKACNSVAICWRDYIDAGCGVAIANRGLYWVRRFFSFT